jgi:hypothetical protein
MKDKSILLINEEIKIFTDKIRKLNSRYSDGSGPRIAVEIECNTNQRALETLCKTLVELHKTEEPQKIEIKMPEVESD